MGWDTMGCNRTRYCMGCMGWNRIKWHRMEWGEMRCDGMEPHGMGWDGIECNDLRIGRVGTQ